MGFWFFLFFRILKPYDLYSILISLDRIAARQALGFGGLCATRSRLYRCLNNERRIKPVILLTEAYWHMRS